MRIPSYSYVCVTVILEIMFVTHECVCENRF